MFCVFILLKLEGPVIQSSSFVSLLFSLFSSVRELEKIINELQGVLFVFKFVNVLNANWKNMVLKIEDSYFELEDFLSELCSKTRGLFGPLWKKVVVWAVNEG